MAYFQLNHKGDLNQYRKYVFDENTFDNFVCSFRNSSYELLVIIENVIVSRQFVYLIKIWFPQERKFRNEMSLISQYSPRFIWFVGFRIQGPNSLGGRASYGKISWSLEVARFGFRLFQPLGNLTGTWDACQISERYDHYNIQSHGFIRGFTRSCGETSVRWVNRGPGTGYGMATPRLTLLGSWTNSLQWLIFLLWASYDFCWMKYGPAEGKFNIFYQRNHGFIAFIKYVYYSL